MKGSHSVQLPHPLSARVRREEGGLTGHQLLEGGCWERGGDFFRGFQFSNKK